MLLTCFYEAPLLLFSFIFALLYMLITLISSERIKVKHLQQLHRVCETSFSLRSVLRSQAELIFPLNQGLRFDENIFQYLHVAAKT